MLNNTIIALRGVLQEIDEGRAKVVAALEALEHGAAPPAPRAAPTNGAVRKEVKSGIARKKRKEGLSEYVLARAQNGLLRRRQIASAARDNGWAYSSAQTAIKNLLKAGTVKEDADGHLILA